MTINLHIGSLVLHGSASLADHRRAIDATVKLELERLLAIDGKDVFWSERDSVNSIRRVDILNPSPNETVGFGRQVAGAIDRGIRIR